ncbi:hypothetical protein SPBR_06214 [Sporothrix brasiliensis 5110]|uniref:Cytochrome c oxidase assembly protein COX20, mitochondrial n=1 Tax=Sporothrix brasiliensis 5110 TaxID=1398154 RepID=A0A0C2IXP8_9PEZI|nr:uncharacterized protein SPBR_06214 [Sporothrix brasiliensis 5110]KIH93911.1 hypothetical protein SPBR_06214 [Sporothrix brasiliensis 5110]
MAGDASSAPSPPPPTTAPTATWGAQHFDKPPTSEELRPSSQTQAESAQSAPQPSPAPAPPVKQTASVSDAVKTIKASDFLTVYQIPCAREGFLTGIGGGAVVGGLRFVLGASIPKAANWAVGAFAVGGIVAFEVCQGARRAEAAKMKRVVEVYDRKQAELRRREADKARAAAAAARAETLRLEEEAKAKRWYKFW